MDIADKPNRFGHHANAFGFLRLLFASLVIVSHTPEIADGDSHREILTRTFGTISFGELAVDAFFIISGFLITGSYLKSRSAGSYLAKRIVRIYPGFAVASLICVFIVAPAGGAAAPASYPHALMNAVIDIVRLKTPHSPDVFSGTHYHVLNQAMWTISAEFRCYLLVLPFGLFGLARKSWAWLALGLSGLMGYLVLKGTLGDDLFIERHHLGLLLGVPDQTALLTGMFACGGAFYNLQHRIELSRRWTIVSLVGLCAGLSVPFAAQFAVALFGAYLIFAAAVFGKRGRLGNINNESDVSYGLYLYAWPVSKLIFWYFPSAPLLAIGASTWLGAYALGWVSWRVVERPAMQLARPARGLPAFTPVERRCRYPSGYR